MPEANGNEPVLCVTTCPDEQVAEKIAGAVVGRQLAACVNILPAMRSIYRWQGAVEDERECLLLIKTRRGQTDKLRDAVITLHPYELPEFIEVPISGGHQPYLNWISENS